MSLLPGRRARWAALGAIVGALAAGGIGGAAIPDNGVVHVCISAKGTVTAAELTTGTCKKKVDLLTPAGEAANAVHADSATIADDALKLGGKDPSAYLATCPAGTVALVDFCGETGFRASSLWNAATTQCADDGRHLPTLEQLKAVWSSNPAAFPGVPEQFFTGDFVDDLTVKAPSAANGVFNLSGTAVVGVDNLRFLCVQAPLQP